MEREAWGTRKEGSAHLEGAAAAVHHGGVHGPEEALLRQVHQHVRLEGENARVGGGDEGRGEVGVAWEGVAFSQEAPE